MVADSNVLSNVVVGSGETRTFMNGTIVGLTVQNGGSFTNLATVSNVTDQGSFENFGSAQNAVVESGGSFQNTATVTSVTVQGSGGFYNYGKANNVSAQSGAIFENRYGSISSLSVQSGADVDFMGGAGSSVTVDSGGSVGAEQSASLTTVTMTAGGSLEVSDGASATDVTITGDAENTLVVGDKGYVSGVNVSGNTPQTSTASEIHDVIVNSGGVADDVTVYHDHMVVNDGGLASGVTLNNAGITVQSNGVVSAVTVTSQGSNYANGAFIDGGVSYDAIVNNNGLIIEYTNGSAYNTTINNGGEDAVLNGLSESAIVSSGGLQLAKTKGVTSGTILDGGQLQVSAGGIASGTTVNAGGLEVVSSGGTAINQTVNASGTVDIQSDGSASNTLVHRYGVENVAQGGVVSNFTIDMGRQNNAGSAVSGLIENLGEERVQSGGYDADMTVTGHGHEVVSAGGTAVNTIFNDTGFGFIAGTLDNATVNSGGWINVSSGGLTSHTTINGSGSEYVNAGGSAVDQTVNAHGTLTIASAGIIGGITVLSGGALSGGVLSAGAKVSALSGGYESGVTITAGGYSEVDSKGTATNISIVDNGIQTVASGGLVSGFEINHARQYDWGSAVSGTISNLAEERVMSGGQDSDMIVTSHGHEVVSAGGIAYHTTYNVTGFGYISGSAVSAVVNSGGIEFVQNGGVATSTTVNKGGLEDVDTGGIAKGETVESGGTLDVYSQGSLQSANVFGGTVDVNSGGSAADVNVASGGRLNVQSGGVLSGTEALQNGGKATIWAAADGVVDLEGSTNTGLTLDGIDTSSATTVTTEVTGFDGNSAGNSDGIVLAGVKAADITSTSYSADGNYVTLSFNEGGSVTLHIDDVSKYGYELSSDADGNAVYEVCFLAGSMIRTPSGDVAVETLQLGDEVLTFADGQSSVRKVTWAGKAHANVRAGLPDDEAGYPVRILKDAIADGVPYKDMLITSEHCLFFEGKFVPVRMLVNGSSIFYDKSITSYDYYHVETEEHSVITADGMLTESYLDTGNRRAFRQAGSVMSMGGKVKSWQEDAVVDLCVDRAFVEPLFRKLADRSTGIAGHLVAEAPQVLTEEPDLHLVTDKGAIVRAVRRNGQRYSFMLRAGTRFVRVVSRAARPADVIGPFVDDRRVMGVAVADVHLAAAGKQHDIIAHLKQDKPEGWHETDWTDCAWTDGNALLPLEDHLIGHEIALLSITIRAAGPYIANTEKQDDSKKRFA
ncbi:AIDA-I autotransporter [Acetobacter pasteurianus subsp. pasteurianus]|uniref:AIDA-I autotransporter n=1 Tax=Acetobacter pasteurianus subsp. pasteurianus TaxID=481145 RepID=A0A1Y0XZJ3_ACEPA|nr:Hint domain-containing protein [Acetobacter pasteurianus]ARW48363.1 AIDA-I autotransporter [Acetobacter pasteurianus subsp. pasteurianus]